jgi:BirA family transcriptional regulator, biotin operon repressor / biotin---[acetyl-CoA-carboxylase] ligase
VSATLLDQALAAAGLSAPVHWQEVTGSTNAVAAALARDGAPEWTLVGAGHQTAGRGRRGRVWHDRPGGSLIVSLVLRPAIPAASAGLLTLLAGAAWAEAASAVTGLDVSCKWPNDLLVGGAKVGGLLAESSVEGGRLVWVVIGSGINLDDPEGVPGATGLGAGVDRGALLGGFLSRFHEGYRADPGELSGAVTSRWSAVSATLGRRVVVMSAGRANREGLAHALAADGGLVLETAEGEVVVASDDVEHVR